MKKCLFVLASLCFFINAIGQSEPKLPFAETIKVSAKDSLLRINPEAKIELKKIAEDQSNKKKAKPIRLYLSASKEEGNNKMARWMAAHLGQNLYKVNLSAVIGKYIGETEKNLDKVFDTAAKSNLILFFDEADALFGKRTTVKDSHDKYANQEVSYFMSHVKKYNGTVFLQCKKAGCIDSAMLLTFIKVGGKQ